MKRGEAIKKMLELLKMVELNPELANRIALRDKINRKTKSQYQRQPLHELHEPEQPPS